MKPARSTTGYSGVTPARCRILVWVFLLAGCSGPEETLFRTVPASESGMDFRNDLTEGPGANIIDYLYFYDGGGVGILDMDADGLMDVFLLSNQGPNRLYRNLGAMRFEDVTQAAGVAGSATWTKGVIVTDIDQDGLHDLYVTNVHHGPFVGRNELFVNQGDGTFIESAAEYGLAFQGLASHAAFLDYDGDLDLDAYLVNHSTHETGVVGGVYLRDEESPEAGDRLLRNDGGRYADVSAEAGIYSSFVGYGLSVGVSDLDRDGCPEIYVANDFHENDYLYRNNCDGTFSELITSAVGHTSRASMGQDIADLDGDGLPEIVVTDMLPDEPRRRLTAAGTETYQVYHTKRNAGYHPQVARNTLLWNRGGGRFSEVGLMAGIEATDWSWAALAADFDSDGRRDLVITNGIPRRPNDLDYLAWVVNPRAQRLLGAGFDSTRFVLDRMPMAPSPNRSFRNRGGLSFEAVAWGVDGPGYSNGAAWADLDNDGDLDLVINNLDAPVSLLANQSPAPGLTVILEGLPPNTLGLGSVVTAWSDGVAQVTEQYLGRGWASSMDPRLHVSGEIDSLHIDWPDHRHQTLQGPLAGPLLRVRQSDASARSDPGPGAPHARFRGGAGEPGKTWSRTAPFGELGHRENEFFDFSREPTIPHLNSIEGPALAIGDVDGDGLDDLFLGGAKWEASVLALQGKELNPWTADSLYEDVDAVFFDADGDHDLDLYVASAGNEFWGRHPALRDRLYRNDGRGHFERDEDALPEHYAQSCCVATGDVDGDGDVDLFVGGRVTSRNYAEVPESTLLLNDGLGVFRDVTPSHMRRPGRLTAAALADFNADGRLDLAVAGDYMPVLLFEQSDTGFDPPRPISEAGHWRSLTALDWDRNGLTDLLAGNLGLNSMLARSEQLPELAIGDFDDDGREEVMLTWVPGRLRRPFPVLDVIRAGLPSVGTRFDSYAAFAGAGGPDLLRRATALRTPITELRSVLLLSQGGGSFLVQPLPEQAQVAPIETAVSIAGGGVVLAGNWSGAEVDRGPHDAGWGLILEPMGVVQPTETGLYLGGSVRRLAIVRTPGGTDLVVARNNGPLHTWRIPK